MEIRHCDNDMDLCLNDDDEGMRSSDKDEFLNKIQKHI